MTFSVGEPHQTALRMVRRALAQHGLRVAAELDITARIKQELGAGVAPCVALYVDDPAQLLQAVLFDRAATLRIPEPVVVSGRGRQTEVLLRGFEALDVGRPPPDPRSPVLNVHERLTRALETIGEREGAHLAARP